MFYYAFLRISQPRIESISQVQPLDKMLLEIIINQVALPGAFSDKKVPIEIYNNYYWCKFGHGIGQGSSVCLSKKMNHEFDWMKWNREG